MAPGKQLRSTWRAMTSAPGRRQSRIHVPEEQCIAEAGRNPGGVEIAVAVGRAQIAAAQSAQDFRCAHFGPHRCVVDAAQRRVVIGVVADAMAGRVCGCGKVGVRRHLPADHEEIGVRAILGQDRENDVSRARLRPVVKGQVERFVHEAAVEVVYPD